MNIYLAKLKEKPFPNNIQKKGVSVTLFSDKKDEGEKLVQENEEVEENNNEKEEVPEEILVEPTQETKVKPKKRCIIKDGRNKTISRETIMETLKSNKIFSVTRKTLPKQMPDNVEIKDYEEEEEKEEEEDTNIPEKKMDEEQDKSDEEEEQDDENKEEKEKITNKKKKIMVKQQYENVDGNKILDGVEINKRMPAKEKYNIRTSSYYMNNRKKFISHLIPLFDKYKKELKNEENVVTCDTKSKSTKKGEFNLMIHQRVVSDYLNLHTPYRGLLLFHGLGSGKTCTSIAIAEGMKSQKQIHVLTLASLKANFFDQMKVCGDPIYRLDQYWEFVSIEGKPDYISLLSNLLSLPESSIKKRNGAWMVNVSKPSNFNDLNDEDKKVLNEQIDEMIRSKYNDINYNGLNDNIMNELTENGKINPFDNSVVIIDEAHNFVSMIVNKMKQKGANSYKLYEYLMAATNTRIVLLSGTPIINYPNEIGIMFNILRGYIKTWTFPIKKKVGSEKLDRDTLISWFEEKGLSEFDYVDFSGENITITRNPFGFINKNRIDRARKIGGKKSGKTQRNKSKKNVSKKIRKNEKREEGVYKMDNGLIVLDEPIGNSVLDETNEQRNERIQAELGTQLGGSFQTYKGVSLDQTGNLTDADFKKIIVKILKDKGIETNMPSKIKVTNNTSLPDISKEFLELFVELDSSEMKNKTVFQKRILGLTSYFKGANDELYPSFVASEYDPVYHIEKVPMSTYQFGLYEKIREEESKQEKNNKKKQARMEKKGAAAAEELFKGTSTYRIASRQCCNFAFPDPPGRPQKTKEELIGKEEIDEMEEEPKKRGNKKMLGGEDSDEDESEDEEIQEEPEKEKLEILGDIVLQDVTNLEEPIERQQEELDEDEEIMKVKKPNKTKKRDDNAKKISEVLGELRLRSKEIFSPSGLKMYSPKYLKLLENIEDKENKGLHLIYSQFRTLEGIALFKEVLEANGYAEFKIQKAGGSDWEMVESDEDVGKPKFALHTGTETDEEKKIILNVYNSKWDEVPSSIVNKLRSRNIENNFMGKTIKILMITSSGAEGINLKNTRFVHIMEPYWNMVRPKQVIGRARRICSHQDLPEELRTVKVYLYMCVIPKDISLDKHKNLRSRDISKLTSKMSSYLDDSTILGRYVRQLSAIPEVITTDQQLFERALQKDQVNSQILTAVKESSIDCTLYENKEENLSCFSFGEVRTNAFSSKPNIMQDMADKDVVEKREQRASYREFVYDGVAYVQNKNTYELYNKSDFEEAQKTRITMYPIGKEIPGKKKVIFY